MPDRFEYDLIYIRHSPEAGLWYGHSDIAGNYSGDGLIAILSAYGLNGWEIVSVDIESRSPYYAEHIAKRRLGID
jgi:hypothetical protein